MDLISELNNINKTNRTFYDFYRDIINIKNEAKDIHLDIYLLLTPNQFNLYFQDFVYLLIIVLFLLKMKIRK